MRGYIKSYYQITAYLIYPHPDKPKPKKHSKPPKFFSRNPNNLLKSKI
jgi:hypothetical protein